MNLPIVAYGHPTLRKVATEIDKDYPGLSELIANMWDTLYHSNGVGLAAPQVNHSIRMFLVDSVQIVEGADEEDKTNTRMRNPLRRCLLTRILSMSKVQNGSITKVASAFLKFAKM